jgi:hypothetical protein
MSDHPVRNAGRVSRLAEKVIERNQNTCDAEREPEGREMVPGQGRLDDEDQADGQKAPHGELFSSEYRHDTDFHSLAARLSFV